MRDPVRPHYDAVVDLYPPERPAEVAYGLVKFTFDLSGPEPRITEADPLLHDIRSDDVEYPFMPGSDFHFYRQATDVVVLGSAYPRDGPGTRRMRVEVDVGRHRFPIEVLGPRRVEWTERGTPRFTEPEPFEEIAVTWENAYGGADRRVPVDPPPGSLFEEGTLQYDHPGVYPRNPFGKGYVVLEDPIEGIELPNLERPDDRLTEERFVTDDPREWYRQPRPAALSWVHPMMFPRYVYLGSEAWHPPPQDRRLPEVEEGILPRAYRDGGLDRLSGRPSPFFQEAPPELVFDEIRPDTPISVSGMHPEGRRVVFALPDPPRLRLLLDGERREPPPRLIGVLVEPERERAALTYAVHTTDLPRAWVPGIHGHVPLALQVHGDDPVRYETPPTVREQVEEGEREQERDEDQEEGRSEE